jgi:drug/metabolite transporter (DMT)-like permease
MLRGFVVVIVAFYSVVLLKHKYNARRWVSVVGISIGVAIVGIASV